MNKDQALQRIAAIEKEAAELRELVNKPDVSTYQDVINKIRPKWYFCVGDGITGQVAGQIAGPLQHTYASEQTASREALRAKWLNIAVYLNDGWTPDWSNQYETKFYLYYDHLNKIICANERFSVQSQGVVYFKSEEAARLALQIMGEQDWKKMNGIE